MHCGCADRGLVCQRSVSIMDSRAATGYGRTWPVSSSPISLSRGWTVVSGGPYDTDAGAHKVGLPASKRADHPTRARPSGMCRRPPSMHIGGYFAFVIAALTAVMAIS